MTMTTDQIRQTYLDFFVERGARRCASDSLVPANDPTLLFTGAGMNQFKDYFLGIGKMDFRRATSCQKCLRTGDIMNVGVTSSHHTFFEMLGNFSFGDYFKTEAISWAWEFLTGPMGIPESRLQVSVHHTDDEAFAYWKDTIGIPESRIFRLGDHDNFWPADAPKLGPNGPCGPCSEIFYDRGEAYGPGILDITHECRRWVEIWNLVFTQYDRQPDGSLVPLSQKNIDTGMGLERMASCLQGTETNMDIDIFVPLVSALAERSGTAYHAARETDVLLRRVADHARAVTFCMADGVMPGNTHRGYVLKRLLRRAVLDGRTLGIGEAFLHDLVPVVARVMGGAYPEVRDAAPSIAQAVRMEEEKFLATLDKGLTLIDMAVGKAQAAGAARLSGEDAFLLYDTYGFPYELAEEVVARHGLQIDRDGFEEAMAAAREKARAGAKMKGDVFAKGPVTDVKTRTGGTEFVGYDATEAEARVVAVVAGDALVPEAGAGTEVTVILDRTPFYGESGGQVGDTGLLVGAGNLVVRIEDTQKIDGIHLHVGVVESGTLREGMTLRAEVDAARRLEIRRNHTVTHLLHHALHEVLGGTAQQKGSYVAAERMRFDFQHPQALTAAEMESIEEKVNLLILEADPVVTSVMPLEEARAAGATALFGEKYGETVRVVSVGAYSTELCGGTHIDNTARIGSFRIVSGEAVAAGVRRLECVTGAHAVRMALRQERILQDVARTLKVPPVEVPQRIEAMQEQEKILRRELQALKADAVEDQLKTIEPLEAGGVPYVAVDLGAVMGKELAAAADVLRRRLGEGGVYVLTGSDGEKAGLVVAVGRDLAPKRLKAGDLVKELAPHIGGGGGGRPELAQAGGKNPAGLPALLAAVPEVMARLLGNG